MDRRRGAIPALITSARIPSSLDADQRNRRYLVTMGVRVLCFLGGCLAPYPYNVILFVGAAILPGLAVILANAVDLRAPADPGTGGAADGRSLSPGTVVPGDVEPRDEGGAP